MENMILYCEVNSYVTITFCHVLKRNFFFLKSFLNMQSSVDSNGWKNYPARKVDVEEKLVIE